MGTDRAEHDSGDHSDISINFVTHLKSFNPWTRCVLMVASSSFVLLVAAASVSQLVQVTLNIFLAGQPVPSVTETTTVVLVHYSPEVTASPCPPVSTGFLEDPYEREILYGSNSFSFLVGGLLAVGASALRCCWAAQPVIRQHGPGAQLQNQRAHGRGRLSITSAGSLGSSLV